MTEEGTPPDVPTPPTSPSQPPTAEANAPNVSIGEETDFAAEHNAATQAPENEATSEAAPADQPTDAASTTPQIPGINYEQDEAKAEVMAHAEDDFRSKAAANRAQDASVGKIIKRAIEVHDVEKDLQKAPQQFSGLQRLGMKGKRARLYGEMQEIVEKDLEHELGNRRAFQHDFSAERHPDGPGRYADKMGQASDRAKYYDQQASRIGDWAGILHDHPLSEEFLKTHSEIPSDPEEAPKILVRLEDNAVALERIIARNDRHSRNTFRAELSALHMDEGQLGVASPQVQEFNQLLNHATPDEAEEYLDIVQEMHSSAKALDDLHDRLYDRLETDPLREQVVLIGDILHDVRQAVGLPVETAEDTTATAQQAEAPAVPGEQSQPPATTGEQPS